MKFEIDPNELTTDQRAHVVEFITNWPTLGFKKMNNIAPLPRNAHIVEEDEHGVKFVILTEEQRLDAEQKRDISGLKEIRESGELREISGAEEAYAIGAAQAVNLNDIFGEPKSSAVPLDSQGLPWDSRIHASTKTFIADGSWKLRRGVDPAEVEKVKAQLKELMAVPTVTIGSAPHVPAATVADAFDINEHNSAGYVNLDPNTVTNAPLIVRPVDIPAPPAPEIVPPAPKSHYLIDQQPATVTLTDLIGRMSAAIAAGKLTQANVTEICVKHGVSEFMLLNNRPDLLPLIKQIAIGL